MVERFKHHGARILRAPSASTSKDWFVVIGAILLLYLLWQFFKGFISGISDTTTATTDLTTKIVTSADEGYTAVVNKFKKVFSSAPFATLSYSLSKDGTTSSDFDTTAAVKYIESCLDPVHPTSDEQDANIVAIFEGLGGADMIKLYNDFGYRDYTMFGYDPLFGYDADLLKWLSTELSGDVLANIKDSWNANVNYPFN